MRREEFSIGMNFITGTGQWRCTDIGTRTIAAIKISAIEIATQVESETTVRTDTNPEPSWFTGPPYIVAEEVFDENDMEGCWT